MKNKKLWIIGIAIIIFIAGGYFFWNNFSGIIGGNNQANAQSPDEQGRQRGNRDNTDDAADLADALTTIRPAVDTNQVSAAGNIALVSQRNVVLQVDGIVETVNVDVGDFVMAGDTLVTLDTTDLERAVTQAELSLASSQTQLDKLLESADAADIASAEASLASAEENLAEVEGGASETELAASESNLASAWEKYNELLEGASEAELVQLGANLQKAIITLQQAQAAYDRVAYSSDVAASSQGANLQQATIDFESAKAAYELATEPTSQAELKAAWSTIKSAQNQLETLRAKPTNAELAAAQAQVANAQAQLENLLNGSGETEIRAAEISVEQAQVNLEKAQADVEKATLQAPIDGTTLTVAVELGQRVSPGLNAITLSDLTALELTVNVSEVDISKVYEGQVATIEIDALPSQTFNGLVTAIAPASDSNQGVVNYPITIRLTDEDLTGVRPGMTAVATILNDEAGGGWLVPSNAIRDRNGRTMVVVIRNGERYPTQVTSVAVQGEWTVVQSPDLQAGDEVIGDVSSFINENEDRFRGFGPPGGGPPGGGR